MLHARSHQRIVDQIAVNQEQTLEVIKVTLIERESGRILEQIVDVPVPQVMKGNRENYEGFRLVSACNNTLLK